VRFVMNQVPPLASILVMIRLRLDKYSGAWSLFLTEPSGRPWTCPFQMTSRHLSASFTQVRSVARAANLVEGLPDG
jgi:hypothetical protein